MIKASKYYTQLRKEVSKMASTANKRLARLESNDLQMSASYRAWEEGGGVRFSVKGKTNEQVASEYWRVKSFLDDTTSTVRGANAVLREMAENTGIKYSNLADLKAKSKQFFDLASKVKQKLQSMEKSAQALQYQKIWEQINEYVRQQTIDLSEVEDVDKYIDDIIAKLDAVQPVEQNKEGVQFGSIWDWIDKG